MVRYMSTEKDGKIFVNITRRAAGDIAISVLNDGDISHAKYKNT